MVMMLLLILLLSLLVHRINSFRLLVQPRVITHSSRYCGCVKYLRLTDGNGPPFDRTVRPLQMSSESSSSSPLDWILDQNVSLGVGVAGILLLLVNRLSLSLDIVSDAQSRADIVAVLACSALLLNVLSDQEIETRERDKVALVGFAISSTAPLVSAEASTSFRTAAEWLVDAIMSCTPATSVHIISSTGKIEAAAGVVASTKEKLLQLQLTPQGCKILKEAIDKREEVYLPDIQVQYKCWVMHVRFQSQ